MPGEPLTTETPLTISGHLGLSEPQQPTMPEVDSFMPQDMESFNYYGSFDINLADPDNKTLFTVETDKLWPENTRFCPANNLQLIKAVHMTTNFVFRFIAVKLPNAPVFLSAQVGYDSPMSVGQAVNTTEAGLFAPNQIIEIDDSSMFDIPLVLPYMGLPQLARVNSFAPPAISGVPSRNHYTTPAAKLILKLRNRFVPTSLHPDSFRVLVFFKMTETQLYGNALDWRYCNFYQRDVIKVGSL